MPRRKHACALATPIENGNTENVRRDMFNSQNRPKGAGLNKVNQNRS